MPSNRLEYTLGVNADTSQARKQIADLYKSLQGVEKLNLDFGGLDVDVAKAADAADKLTSHLRAAVNVDTGKLNLIKLNQSIKESGDSLSTLVSNLSYGGQIGQQAFEQLATAISKTEVPLKTMNATLSSALTTLQNTIKWQLSSNIVHGLQGAFSGAVGYAQDLNKTLTDIRIVTGMSVDDMAKFANNANKAAKELSTTTKAYADASLIYYQQGDSAELAAKKAATTIKAANVAFTASAQEMSEMLTAVWNSYQVGSDQLEHVVDVMANLGAKTASSMEEMATAMQKVASTANTVGVSMEQMSAIVATSASVTRQAPETVGTAWNTILSRIGGLKLGKTLEDGVDLNKYSSALATVGVNILDTTGELREMGTVIDEIGVKWQTLSSGQKAALAQTIGGARQYTQIMAFFENFDKYQQNMDFANNSQGALQKQQEIYAQGWEAASKRVRAAMESIYSSLINDQAIIKATNGIANIVNGLSSFIKTLGGAKGAISAFGSILLSVFSDRIGAQIKNIAAEINNIFVDQKKQFEAAYNEMRDQIQMNADATDSVSMSYQLDLLNVKKELLAKEQYLSDAQKATINSAIEGYTNQINKLHELEVALNDVTKMNENHEKAFNNVLQSAVTNNVIDQQKQSQLSTTYGITKNNLLVSNIADYFPDIKELDKFSDIQTKVQSITGAFESLKDAVSNSGNQDWINKLNSIDLKNLDDTKLKELVATIQQIGREASQTGETGLQSLRQQIDALPDGSQKQSLIALFNDLREQLDSAAHASVNFNQANANTENTLDKLKQKLQSFPTTFNKIFEGISKAGSAMLALRNVSVSFNNATTTMQDSTAKLSDKLGALGSAATSAGMAFATLKQALTFLSISNPVSMVIAGAATAAMAVSSIMSGREEVKQQQRQDRAQKSSELANALSEEDTQIQNLYDSYYELETARKKSGEVTDEYLNVLDQLLASLGLERESVGKNAQAYDELATSIAKANSERNVDNQKKYQQAFENSINALPGGKTKNKFGITVGDFGDQKVLSSLGFGQITSNAIGGPSLPEEAGIYQYLEQLKDNGKPEYLAQLAIQSLTEEDKKELYEKIRDKDTIQSIGGDVYTIEELQSVVSRKDFTGKYDVNSMSLEELAKAYDTLQGRKTFDLETLHTAVEEDMNYAIANYFIGNVEDAIDQILSNDSFKNDLGFQQYQNDLQKARTANEEKIADFVFPDRDDINGWLDLTLTYDYTKSKDYLNISSESQKAVEETLGNVISDQMISEARAFARTTAQTAVERNISDIKSYDDFVNIIRSSLGLKDGEETPEWLENLVLTPIYKQLPKIIEDNELMKSITAGYETVQSQKATFDWGKLNGTKEQLSDEDQYALIAKDLKYDNIIEKNNKLDNLFTDYTLVNSASSLKDLLSLKDKYKIDENFDDDVFGLFKLKQKLIQNINKEVDNVNLTDAELTEYTTQVGSAKNKLWFDFYKNYVPSTLEESQDFTPEQISNFQTQLKSWKFFKNYQQASNVIGYFSGAGKEASGLSPIELDTTQALGLTDEEGKWTDLAEAYSKLLDLPFRTLQLHMEQMAPKISNTSDELGALIDQSLKVDVNSIFSLKQNPDSWNVDDYKAFINQAQLAGIEEERIKGYANANSLDQQKVWRDLLSAGINQAKEDKVDSQQIELWEKQLNSLNKIIDASDFQNKIKPYQEALSSLSSEINNITSGKGLSQKSKDILERVGIDTSKIKDIKSYTQALKELQSDLYTDYQTQLKEYNKDGKNFNPYLSQEAISAMSKDDQEEYNRLLQLREEINNVYEAILSSYSTAQQQYADEVNASIQEMEANYNRLEQANEKLQTKAETAASSIGKNITEVQAQQMGLSNATEWSSKTIELQVQFAADALNEAYTAQSKLLGQQMDDWQSLVNVVKDSTDGMSQFLSKFTDETNDFATNGKSKFLDVARDFFDDKQIRALSQAWDKASQELDFSKSKMSDKQIWEAIKQQAGDTLAAIGVDLDKLSAEYTDNIQAIGTTISEKLQQDANEAVSTWEQAFNTIAGLRTKLFSGESIVGDLTSDINTFVRAFASSGMSNPSEFFQMAKSGKITGDMLKLPQYDVNVMRNSLGLSLFNNSGKFNAQSFWNNAYKQAGNDSEAARDFVRNQLNTLLTNGGVSSQTERDNLIEEYLREGEDSDAYQQIYQAAEMMWNAAEAFREGQLENQSYLESQSKRDRAIEDAQNQLEVQDRQADKYQGYVDMASTFLQDQGEHFSSELLGDKMGSSEWLNAVNDAIGTNYTNIDQLDKLDDSTWQRVYDYYSDMAQQQYEAAAQTQSSITKIYKQFLEDTIAIFGKDSREAKDAQLDLDDAARKEESTNSSRQAATDQNKDDIITNYAKQVNMANKEFVEYAKTLQSANNYTTDLNKLTAAQTRQLYAVAASSIKAEEGFNDLQKSQKENLKILEKGDTAYKGYPNALRAVTKDVKKIFGDSKAVDQDFVKNHIKQIQAMADGDKEAAEQVEHALLEEQAKLDGWGDHLIDVNGSGGIQDELNGLIDQLNSFGDKWANEPIGFTVDANTEPAIKAFDQLLASGQMTADQITAALNDVGWEPEIEYTPVPVSQFDGEDISGYVTVQLPTGKTEQGTVEGHETAQTETYVLVPHLKSAKKTGGGASSTPKPSHSGGGGGGSKGKEHTKKEPKRIKDEGERYHEIRDQMEQQEHILDRIDKIKDRAYGDRHLKALNAEIEALEKQNKLQKEYYAEAAAYLASDRAELTSYGATFNSDGTINYDEYIRKQIDWYNASVDASNDDETDKLIEEEYKDRMKALENYEEALDLVDTIQNDILENQNKISEILLEGVQYKLEIAVDLNDRDLQKLDYYINKWSEVLSKQDESMEVSMMKMGDYESSLAAVGKAYQELQKGYAEGRLNDQDYSDGLADLQDKTLEYLESIQDLKKEIEEYYENTLSLAEEKQQKYTDKIEHTRNMMQSYIEMQQLMGRGQNFAELNSMYDTSYRSSLLTARAARDYLDTLYASRAAIVKEIEDSGWTETLKAQYDSVEEHIINAEDDLAQKTQQTLDDAKQKFMNVIDAIIKASDLAFKSLVDANGNLIKSFDEVAQDFNYWNEQQGWYVSTAKELYEVSKINRQIEDSLIDSTTATSKERLKALQSEINAYAEKNRLTEYDIEMNELQYKMALAMQNLEDTQNAKSTVRLTRDENGNYGYQYTANEDDVSEARQNFEDVLQQINELAYEHQNDLVQQMIESKQNYQSELREILDNDTLSLEERNRQAETLTEQHLAQMEYIQEQGLRAQEQLLENQGYIQEYYGQTIIENTGLVQDQIHGMMQQLMQDSSGYVEYIRTTLRQQLDEAIGGYSHDIDKVGGETGLTWGTMENSVSVYNKTNEKAAEDIKTLDQILGDSLKNISSATDSWVKHNAALETTVGNYEQLLNKMQGLQRSLADIDSINDRYYNNGAIYRPSEMGTTAALNALYNNKNTTNFTEDQFEGSANALGRLHNTTMSEYDISTSNLWNLIDSGAMSNLLGLISRGVNPNVINGNTNGDALSQVVNINASFDNIQSAQDIIDAFNQLTNLASQYAYSSGS